MNKMGGTKNLEWINYFQQPVKLVYLHTNWKFKKHQENQYFLILYTNFIKYRTQYRKTLLKSTLSPISHPKSQPTIQTTFFLYKYKILIKIHIFTDYQLFTKFTYKSTSNFSYLTSENYYLIQQPYQTFLTCNP